jgi:imidazolonepropionase
MATVNSFVLAPIGELHLPKCAGPTKGAAMNETRRMIGAGVVVREGRIGAIGDAESILRDYRDLPRIDAADNLVTPGLVDCHTHLSWAGNRADEFIRRCRGTTYEQIANEGGGIVSSALAMESAEQSGLVKKLLARCDLLLSLGTTTIEVKASYGLTPESSRKEVDAISEAALRANATIVATYMGAHAFPSGVPRSEYLSLLESEMIPYASKHAKFNDVFCEVGAFTVEESRKVLEWGLENRLRPKIHSDEFNALGGTEMAVSIGAVSCDHLLNVAESGIKALAASNTIAVTMPGTAFYLDKPYANARKLIDAGCAVALGSDFNPGSSQIPSMAFAMGLAVARTGMTPEEALTAATVNAAAAIGEEVGSLEVGERADICVWPCSSIEELIYEFAFIRPTAVFAKGERVV